MSKQSLQKLTDFKAIDKLTKEELSTIYSSHKEARPYLDYLLGFINGDDPDKKPKYLDKLTTILISIGDSEQAKEIKRVDYEANNSKIKSYLHNWGLTNNGFPNIAHIAEETGLSRTTVYKHLKETSQADKDLNSNIRQTMREHALETLFKIGVKENDTKALGMFVKLTEPKEDKTTKQTINNNYLTINNFRISQDTIEALPETAQEEIQRIIQANIINA